MTEKFSFELPFKNRTTDYLESLYWDARHAINRVTKGSFGEYLDAIQIHKDDVYPDIVDNGLRRTVQFDDAVSDLVRAIDWMIGREDDEDISAIRKNWLGTTKPMNLEDLPDAARCWYNLARTFLDGAEFVCKQQELWGAEMSLTC